MERISLQDISRILVSRHGLNSKEAADFAQQMFDVIRQHLQTEGQVKVKGLGTFKTIKVEARESVNVNTGERFTIDSHSKVSFTPDGTMKELVNKPFSQFETVVLNDGVEFDDIVDEQQESDDTSENVEQRSLEPFVETQEPAVNSVGPEEHVSDANTAEEQPILSAPLVEVVDSEPQTDENDLLESLEEENVTRSSWRTIIAYAVGTLILMAASAYAGFWYGRTTVQQNSCDANDSTVIADTLRENSIAPVSADSTSLVAVPDSLDSVSTTTNDSVTETKTAEPEFDYKKYEDMDVRVRTGAYHIVGTDHEVTVRKDETLTKICRRELGDGMICYVEVYNGITANDQLHEGQIIKIPKLKWKLKRKNQ